MRVKSMDVKSIHSYPDSRDYPVSSILRLSQYTNAFTKYSD